MKTLKLTARAVPTAPVVICLHSSASTGGQWAGLRDELGDAFHVVTPDLFGQGQAPAWTGAASDIVAADVERIAHIAKRFGGGVHLVGHSYGGFVALRIALEYPSLVASVAVYEPVAFRVLFDYNARHQPAVEVLELARGIGRDVGLGQESRAASRFVNYWSGSDQWSRLSPEQRSAIAARMPVVLSHFVSLAHDGARRTDFARLPMPVLYLTGQATRASTRRIAEIVTPSMPHVESVRMEAMGHLGPITHAAVVASRVARFVREQASPPFDQRKAA
jgi:pimeloyl-ACP methyl ester carboxylesterase